MSAIYFQLRRRSVSEGIATSTVGIPHSMFISFHLETASRLMRSIFLMVNVIGKPGTTVAKISLRPRLPLSLLCSRSGPSFGCRDRQSQCSGFAVTEPRSSDRVHDAVDLNPFTNDEFVIDRILNLVNCDEPRQNARPGASLPWRSRR